MVEFVQELYFRDLYKVLIVKIFDGRTWMEIIEIQQKFTIQQTFTEIIIDDA